MEQPCLNSSLPSDQPRHLRPARLAVHIREVCEVRSREIHVDILGVASVRLTVTARICRFDSYKGWRFTSTTTS